MKKLLKLLVYSFALVLVAAPMASEAAIQTFFADYFTNSSTINQPVTAPTTNSTSYQTAVGVAGGTNSLTSGALNLTFPNNSGVLGEFFALFTNASSPITLSQSNDFIALTIVFINSSNILGGLDTANASINVGMFDAGGVPPNQGHIVLSTGTTAGGTEDWLGYFGRFLLTGGNASVRTRPAQTPAASSQNQDLLFSNASGSQSFNLPPGATIGSDGPATGAALTNGATYTIHLVITLGSPGILSISNALYAGVGTGTTPMTSQIKVTTGTPLTSGFNGLALGWRNTGGAQASSMTVNSIVVYGQSTIVTSPPDIVTQPASASVATGGACAFSVVASGFNMTYQWHRNGTNLVDGGNISGANSDLLVVSSASTADVCSGANGYYVTITGTGNYSTNSSTAALSLRTAKSLDWTAAAGTTWDLNSTASWQDPGLVQSTFNYGDSVTFGESTGSRQVTLTGKFLGASSVTVNNSTLPYNFVPASQGSFGGPGSLYIIGSSVLSIGNINTFTGGTVISNNTAYLMLNNYSGLGSGPVTFAQSGGTIQINPVGSATIGLPGDIHVDDDFTVQFEPVGTFSGVFFGNFSGASGKTLTFNPSSTNGAGTFNQRIRIYGTNTTYNANLLLNSAAVSLAMYLPSGIQTYNGVISGPGGLIQRGNGTTILNNAQNSYSGGTIPTAGNIAFGVDSVGPAGAVTSGPIGTGPLNIAPEVANLTGNGTVLSFGGPRIIGNPLVYPSGTNNQTLIIGGSNNLTFTGPIALNGADGSSNFTNRIFQVGNIALTTFSGVISGPGDGLVKSGNGVLALDGINTYSGSTTVSNGTLLVNGQIGSGSVLVISNATLGGTGTIGGPVTILTNGVLAAGASIGTLTINNNLALSGNVRVEVNTSVNPSNDLTVVSGTLANNGAGTVIVSNLGPALVAGKSFKIFNKAVANGNAMTITGGGTGLAWANNLAADGSISVSAALTTSPLITSANVVGSNFSLSGTNGALDVGYYILATTNLTVPLTNWTRVLTNTFGPGGGFSANIPIVPSQPVRFYLLQVR